MKDLLAITFRDVRKFFLTNIYKFAFIHHFQMMTLTLGTSEAGIPALRKLPYGVGSLYTAGTVCEHQAPEVGIPVARYVNARRQK